MLRAHFLTFFTLLAVVSAGAVELQLPEGSFWAVIASRQDQNEAIAAARARHDASVVVKVTNGRFATIDGPYRANGKTARRVLADLVEHGAPKDTYLDRGTTFTNVVWRPPPTHVSETLRYDGEHDVQVVKDGLEIKVSRRPASVGEFVPQLTVNYKDRPSLAIRIASDPTEKPAARVDIVRLDPASPIPQIAFSYYSQGAHCCTLTKFASLDRDQVWHVIDGEPLDGDGGYYFEDLEGKGYADLISIDQSFLYAFDSYGASNSATKVHRLEGDKIVDVTREPQFQATLLQDLYTQEASARAGGAEVWHSNGFLAGWVASSVLVNRGSTAWSRMLADWDRKCTFGPDICLSGASLDKCPTKSLVKVAFPVALRHFLIRQGYITTSDDYPIPSHIETRH